MKPKKKTKHSDNTAEQCATKAEELAKDCNIPEAIRCQINLRNDYKGGVDGPKAKQRFLGTTDHNSAAVIVLLADSQHMLDDEKRAHIQTYNVALNKLEDAIHICEECNQNVRLDLLSPGG